MARRAYLWRPPLTTTPISRSSPMKFPLPNPHPSSSRLIQAYEHDTAVSQQDMIHHSHIRCTSRTPTPQTKLNRPQLTPRISLTSRFVKALHGPLVPAVPPPPPPASIPPILVSHIPPDLQNQATSTPSSAIDTPARTTPSMHPRFWSLVDLHMALGSNHASPENGDERDDVGEPPSRNATFVAPS